VKAWICRRASRPCDLKMSHFSRIRRAGANRSVSLRLLLGLALWLVGAGWLAPALGAPKGSALFKQARQAELREEYDQALELYKRAQDADPENQLYMMAVRRLRFVAGQWHVDQGHKLFAKGQLPEAAAEFEKALTIDPASSIAEQELKRTREMMVRKGARKPPSEPVPDAPAPPGEITVSPLAAARKEAEELLETAQSIPKLKPISSQPLNLKISNNSKVIFETVGKLAGINVLFDPEYQDRRVTLELNNATLTEALDYVGTIAKAFWKPLSANAILVTNDNPTKRRDYEEQVVKTFYLSNAYTAQELQEIATAIRTLADIRRLFTINSLNAMVVRAEADKVALAEKLINDVDKSRAEVIIDVLVLEASRTRTRELGIAPVSGGAPSISIPIAFTPRNPVLVGGGGGTGGTGGTGGGATTGSSAISLARVSNVSSNDFSLILPGAGIKALMSSSDTRVLQSPRIRGFDGYKASLRIGDRIPIATGSFQPGIGGVGINPLVNTQFNYQDVGVNVDLTPRIHAGKEISMHIEIEISNVRDFVDIGGISQPVIGQRKVIHDIRLKEGEWNIIGGLIQSQTSKSVSGVPGLAQIPLLGRLFSNERLERSENEILIALVPHVVRVPDLTDLNMRGISSGTEQQVKVTYTPAPNDHPALPPVPPATPAPAASPPLLAPPPAPPPADAASAVPSSRAENIIPRLRLDRPQVQEAVGGRINLNLLVENVNELFAASLRLTFDPAILRMNDARKGGFLSNDGQEIIFSKNVHNETGEASVQLSRFPGAGGISGGGVLLTLEMQGVAPGKAAVKIVNTDARNAKLESIKLDGLEAEAVIR